MILLAGGLQSAKRSVKQVVDVRLDICQIIRHILTMQMAFSFEIDIFSYI